MNNIRLLRKFQPVITANKVIPTNKRVSGLIRHNMSNQNKSIVLTDRISKEDLQKITKLLENINNNSETMVNIGLNTFIVLFGAQTMLFVGMCYR